MFQLINQQGIEEIIHYIDQIQPLLNKTKTELGNYLNSIKHGKLELNVNGTIDDQIDQYESVLRQEEKRF